MERIYEDANDQHIVGTFVYVKTGKAYSDTDCKVGVPAEMLKDLFYKGAVIVDNKKEYKPVAMNEASGTVTLTYVTADTTPTTAKLATVQSVAAEE
jgi:hypothetical protein